MPDGPALESLRDFVAWVSVMDRDTMSPMMQRLIERAERELENDHA